MKVYVELNGEWKAIPCTDKSMTVSWLIEEAIRRSDTDSNKVYQLSSARGGISYYSKDQVGAVLEDGQFLRLSDVSLPKADQNKETGSGVKHLSYGGADITSAMGNLKLHNSQKRGPVIVNGEGLTTEMLCKLATGAYHIQISPGAERKVQASRKILDDIVEEGRVVYGVSTGFGSFARVVVPKDDLDQLQVNLILSHCAGVGKPLSPERTRSLLALRINVLCKGYSGISPQNLDTMIKAFNASCLPWIPEKGTVGASGDLAPLSHLALGLMGQGKMWSPSSGWAEAEHVLAANNIRPIKLGPKEGLAMINGAQFITALGCEALERANRIALQADVVAALTLEVLQGTSRAFDEAIHLARPHKGQIEVAKRLRTLLQYKCHLSEISESHKNCNRIQDSYTLRCSPQVHGICHDTIKFVRGVLDVECNSATDNPMVIIERQETISGGNFHGEYPAKALDYLAIGVHEIGAISERRIERLCNPAYSDLPAFLVQNGGLNSGFMIPHCTAAALVSENKCLCHPSSVDSLSTSAGQEDHVSMGGWAARKAIQVVEHVEYVVAIELLCACQGIEFHRPMKSTDALEAVHACVREVVPAYDKDRLQHEDIEAVAKLLRENRIWECVEGYLTGEPASNQVRFGSPTSSYTAMGQAPL